MTNEKDIGLRNAWLCFIMHMMIEVECFAIATHTFNLDLKYQYIMALTFDIFAFAPQFIIGLIHEKFPKFKISLVGSILMILGVLIVNYNEPNIYSIISIVIVAIGNAILHDCCAIQTVLLSKGKLFYSALFVGGGSFGLIIGQTLGNTDYLSKWYLFIPALIILFIDLFTMKDWLIDNYKYPKFDIVNKSLVTDKFLDITLIIILVAFIVTTTRSYIGYAIPVSWKKELWQSFLLFSTMGTGKALGGYLSDKFGAYKVGVLSTLFCIPFLIVGDTLMIISIIGVFMFSLTMSITFGMLLSVMNDNPGLAFGVTTMALLFGTLPIFFVRLDKQVNIILVIVLSLLCSFLLKLTLKNTNKEYLNTD